MCLYYYLFGCAFLGNDKYFGISSAVLAHLKAPNATLWGVPKFFLTLYSTICLINSF
jgi:hypothetical protein